MVNNRKEGVMKKLVRDVISVNELNPAYVHDITDRAVQTYMEIRNGKAQKYINYIAGSTCCVVFWQESTRTYDTFGDAFRMLGAENIVGFRNAEVSSAAKGESIFHTIDTFVGQGKGSRYIAIRTGIEGSARWAAIAAFRSFAKRVREYAKVCRNIPQNLIQTIIINGGDKKHHHPTQSLLDCATIKFQQGNIEGINFGEGYDIGGSRVVSSHIYMASLLGWNMHLCAFNEPDAHLNLRQKYHLLKNHIAINQYDSIQKMLPEIGLLYVSRYQYNQRGQKTGTHAADMFDDKHPRISRELVLPYSIPIYHARPIDRYAREITPDLYDHPHDCSSIQSDFGDPTRMAIVMFAEDNGLFSLKGIINSLNPAMLGFYKEDLSQAPAKTIKDGIYTTANLKDGHGFVIDHIPIGCGGVMSNLIAGLNPNIPIVLSMNVKGDRDRSIPKDMIKLHVPKDFEWTDPLSNIIALFSDYTTQKSCRVSQFRDGKRIAKWSFRILNCGSDRCNNEYCITNPSYGEDIYFHHITQQVNGFSIKECPFCETPQPSPELTALGIH